MPCRRACASLALLAMLWLGLGAPAQAAIVGSAPFTRPGSPDFSQLYADNTFSPLTGHAAWWGENFLAGDSRPLDGVVFVGLLPEPGAPALVVAAFAAAGAARLRLDRSAGIR